MKLLRVHDIMNPETDTVQANRKVAEFLSSVVMHDTVPVVDEREHVIGVLYRRDLLNADGAATAASLAHTDYPLAYTDEVVHDVAVRFLHGGYEACPVIDRATGELAGMLTAYDVLKAKNWEIMQENPEPSHLSGVSLLRFPGTKRA